MLCRRIARFRRLLRYALCLCVCWLPLIALIITAYSCNKEGAWSPPGVKTVVHSDQPVINDRTSQQHVNSTWISAQYTYLHISPHKTTPTPSTANEVPILDTYGIKIMPKSPILVAEGHSLQVSCVATQLLHRQQDQAPYLTFELPQPSLAREQQLSMSLRPGNRYVYSSNNYVPIYV